MIDLQEFQKDFLKVSGCFTEINSSLGVLSFGKEIISVESSNIGDVLVFGFAHFIGFFVLLFNDQEFPSFCALFAGVEFGDTLVAENPKDSCFLLISHVADQTAFEIFHYNDLLSNC